MNLENMMGSFQAMDKEQKLILAKMTMDVGMDGKGKINNQDLVVLFIDLSGAIARNKVEINDLKKQIKKLETICDVFAGETL